MVKIWPSRKMRNRYVSCSGQPEHAHCCMHDFSREIFNCYYKRLACRPLKLCIFIMGHWDSMGTVLFFTIIPEVYLCGKQAQNWPEFLSDDLQSLGLRQPQTPGRKLLGSSGLVCLDPEISPQTLAGIPQSRNFTTSWLAKYWTILSIPQSLLIKSDSQFLHLSISSKM